jgi:hypothetical protein
MTNPRDVRSTSTPRKAYTFPKPVILPCSHLLFTPAFRNINISLNEKNIEKAKEILETSISNSKPIIVTYYKNNKSHCAAIVGDCTGKDGNRIGFIVNDSALQDRDFILSSDLKSQFWKIQIKTIYYFNK